jgi:hypothetical protein
MKFWGIACGGVAAASYAVILIAVMPMLLGAR